MSASLYRRLAHRAVRAAAMAALLAGAAPAWAKDYLITASHSGRLFLFDAAERALVKDIPIAGGAALGVQPSPDGKVAYVMNDQLGVVRGIELDSGKEVFLTRFSDGDIRGRGFAAMAVSPDGKELYAVVFRTRLKKTEYEVLDPVLNVYATNGGLDAKPIRSYKVSRQIATMFAGTKGDRLYLIGPDVMVMDPRTGKIVATHPIRSTRHPKLTPPDVFGVWSQFSQANVWVNPTFMARKDLPPTDPAAFRTGMMRIDLASGKFSSDEFENTAAIIFSAVVSPVNHDDVYGVYTQLSKVDMKSKTLVKRVELDHTYYTVNISSDGKELYVGGTMGDIGVYDSQTLEKKGEMKIPDGSDMAASWVQIIKRD